MIYWVWLRKRSGKTYIYSESLLPGLPDARLIEKTYDQYVEKIGVCKNCDGRIAHVIEHQTGRKFCPILFHDLLRKTVGVKWNIEDLV